MKKLVKAITAVSTAALAVVGGIYVFRKFFSKEAELDEAFDDEELFEDNTEDDDDDVEAFDDEDEIFEDETPTAAPEAPADEADTSDDADNEPKDED